MRLCMLACYPFCESTGVADLSAVPAPGRSIPGMFAFVSGTSGICLMRIWLNLVVGYMESDISQSSGGLRAIVFVYIRWCVW